MVALPALTCHPRDLCLTGYWIFLLDELMKYEIIHLGNGVYEEIDYSPKPNYKNYRKTG